MGIELPGTSELCNEPRPFDHCYRSNVWPEEAHVLNGHAKSIPCVNGHSYAVPRVAGAALELVGLREWIPRVSHAIVLSNVKQLLGRAPYRLRTLDQAYLSTPESLTGN